MLEVNSEDEAYQSWLDLYRVNMEPCHNFDSSLCRVIWAVCTGIWSSIRESPVEPIRKKGFVKVLNNHLILLHKMIRDPSLMKNKACLNITSTSSPKQLAHRFFPHLLNLHTMLTKFRMHGGLKTRRMWRDQGRSYMLDKLDMLIGQHHIFTEKG